MNIPPSSKLKPLITEVQIDGLGFIRKVPVTIALHLKELVDHDMSFLAHRMMTEHKMKKDYIRRGIQEVKRYHAIGIVDPTYVHAVSRNVDPFWHEHLHFTVDYRVFCDKICGKFKDHFPIDESARHQIVDCYKRSLEIYEEFFGTPDEAWWGPLEHVCLDANHLIGEYMNGYYKPIDWKPLLK